MFKSHSALYYPHISLENEALLKNALLLWDSVEVLCPFNTFPRFPVASDQREAFTHLARPLRPSQKQMQLAHDEIVRIADNPLPEWFFPKNVPSQFRYSLHPEKFLPDTWNALRKTRLARPSITELEPPISREMMSQLGRQARTRVFETTQAFGLTMLSILAKYCAGETRELVTDEFDAYAAYDQYLKLNVNAKPATDRSSHHDRLATLSLLSLDLSKVSLSRLTKLRVKEESAPSLRAMRHSYRRKLDDYADRLRSSAKTQEDVAEIERVFMQEIADDMGLLKEELRDDAKHVIFSKEIAVGAVVLAGGFVEPVATKLLAAGSLYKAKLDFSVARKRTLAKHPTSWLYQLKRFRPW